MTLLILLNNLKEKKRTNSMLKLKKRLRMNWNMQQTGSEHSFKFLLA
jgi:hypothetical protein